MRKQRSVYRLGWFEHIRNDDPNFGFFLFCQTVKAWYCTYHYSTFVVFHQPGLPHSGEKGETDTLVLF